MKLHSFNDNDFLLLYAAGTGGEFLTTEISRSVPYLNTLSATIHNNRYQVACKRTYADVYKKDNNYYFDSYVGETDKASDIYKDHLVDSIFGYWPQDINVIYLSLSDNFDYWADITWAKLHTINIDTNYDQFKNDHILYLRDCVQFSEKLPKYFNRTVSIDINQMHLYPVGEQLKNVFGDFNIEYFNTVQKQWIKNNNELRSKI